MKFLVLTDIHGSSKYLKLAIEKFNNLNCEKMLLLGDILYHGPRNDLPLEYNPKEVISILNSYKDKVLCIKGNCDAEVDEMVLEFPLYPTIMLTVNGVKLELIHGHNLEELVHLTDIGMSNDEAIASGTVKAAEFLNQDNLGLVKENYVADLILVNSNPLDDISILSDNDNILKVIYE